MKKLFISCPMKGRTDENIKDSMARMHRIAEAAFNEELEVIPTYIENDPPENVNAAIWYLAESIKKMSEADYFIGIHHSEFFKGCNNEVSVAHDYGIPVMRLDIYETMPDAAEIERLNWEEKRRIMGWSE